MPAAAASTVTNPTDKTAKKDTKMAVPSPMIPNAQATATTTPSDTNAKIESSTPHEEEQDPSSNSKAASKGNFHSKVKKMQTAAIVKSVLGAAANEKSMARSAVLKNHV